MSRSAAPGSVFEPSAPAVDWIAQLVPSQTSTKLSLGKAPGGAGAPESPTAVQEVLDAHDTPASSTVDAPAGLGLACTVQLVPSQASTNESSGPPCAESCPTAVQEVLDTHEMPLRVLVLPLAPLGSGVDWIVQLVPSHLSANVNVPVLVS